MACAVGHKKNELKLVLMLYLFMFKVFGQVKKYNIEILTLCNIDLFPSFFLYLAMFCILPLIKKKKMKRVTYSMHSF